MMSGLRCAEQAERVSITITFWVSEMTLNYLHFGFEIKRKEKRKEKLVADDQMVWLEIVSCEL